MAHKRMLITGSSRGIGAATARLAAAHGYDVCLSYINDQPAADAIADYVRAKGQRALVVKADVANEDDIENMYAAMDTEFGGIDVLVNNAGIVKPQASVTDMTSERLRRVFEVNIMGSFLCAREAVLRMSTKRGGSGGVIVNLSSAAAKLGSPHEFVDYAASKGAIDTFTVGLAKEVATEGIRVNGIRPGLIETDIHASYGEPDRAERLRTAIPMQRAGSAEEVADAVIWLASEQSSYVTSSIIDVAGGR
jgi:NAD(P)-dependent dehydrogenase (short-subunit alcohol dehydrogenase family)